MMFAVDAGQLQRLTTTVALVSLCLAGGPTARAQSAQTCPGDPSTGRRIFVERGCIRCHSIWGNGGELGPDFALVGAGRSLQQLAGLFWNHTPRMIETVRNRGIEWPTFSEEELADIISYIYYVKLFDEPGNPEFGERWFREKRCRDCHTVGGRGNPRGPALDGYAEYVGPLMLAEGMWNHGPQMQAQQSARGIPMPTFVGRELTDIHAYIREASSLRQRTLVFLEPPDIAAGQRLYVSKGCVGCHGASGRGTAYAPDLRTATQRMRVSEIAGTLWNHSFRMAAAMRARGIPFPQFQGSEMADVIAFLYYLRFYETEGDVAAGERLFAQKGCLTCHGGAGRAAVGPDLSMSEAAVSPLALATSMWNHAPAMYDQLQLEAADWPRFEGEEMRDLSVYLRSLATPGSR